jgi:hypothetical protein
MDNAQSMAALQDQLNKINESLNALQAANYGKRLSNLPQEELLQEIIRTTSEAYKTIDFLTTTANVYPIEQALSGAVFQVIAVTNNDLSAYVDVRFNSPMSSAIRMYLGDRIVTPFRSFWVSNPAQAGITFKFGIGAEFDNVFRFDKNFSGNIGSIATINNIISIPQVRSLDPSTGNQVLGYLSGAGTIWTVTATKTLQIRDCWLECRATEAGSAASLTIYDDSGGYVTTLIAHTLGIVTIYGSRTLLATVPAGYTIRLTCTATADVKGGFSGWEE